MIEITPYKTIKVNEIGREKRNLKAVFLVIKHENSNLYKLDRNPIVIDRNWPLIPPSIQPKKMKQFGVCRIDHIINPGNPDSSLTPNPEPQKIIADSATGSPGSGFKSVCLGLGNGSQTAQLIINETLIQSIGSCLKT